MSRRIGAWVLAFIAAGAAWSAPAPAQNIEGVYGGCGLCGNFTCTCYRGASGGGGGSGGGLIGGLLRLLFAPSDDPAEEAPKVDPAVVEALRLNDEAIGLADRDDHAGAARLFEQALEKRPNDETLKQNLRIAKGHAALAEMNEAYRRNDLARALEKVAEALRYHPDDRFLLQLQENFRSIQRIERQRSEDRAKAVADAGALIDDLKAERDRIRTLRTLALLGEAPFQRDSLEKGLAQLRESRALKEALAAKTLERKLGAALDLGVAWPSQAVFDRKAGEAPSTDAFAVGPSSPVPMPTIPPHLKKALAPMIEQVYAAEAELQTQRAALGEVERKPPGEATAKAAVEIKARMKDARNHRNRVAFQITTAIDAPEKPPVAGEEKPDGPR